tara:strand:- start:4845 stop:5237 length:393 start_codon:yes stop_codon:yes gene_type:complete
MGLIKNPQRIKQVIDFTGVQNGKIHPSDIDAVLEFDSKYLLLFELKKVGNKVPIGQRMMLERIIDSWEKSGNIGSIVYCEHDTMSHETIMFKDCKIIGLYNRGQYKEYNNDLTDFLWQFGIKYNIDKLIA